MQFPDYIIDIKNVLHNEFKHCDNMKQHCRNIRISLIFTLIIISSLTFGQHKHLNMGFRDHGLCFGNSKKNDGIRLNLCDRMVDATNGINISGFSSAIRSNGIGIGILGCNDSIRNGISIGGIGVGGNHINGIAISGLAVAASKLNGIGISIFFMEADTMNGLFASILIDLNTKSLRGLAICIENHVELQRGVSIGLETNDSKEVYGIQIGLVNKTKQLHGFQFGIWNIAENNKIFKKMPIMNFNLRRKRRK